MENLINEMEEKVKDFITSPLKNMWIEDDNSIIKIYIRKSKRVLEGDIVNCLDFASVEIMKEDYMRKGLFKSILLLLEKLNPYNMLVVESILNPFLLMWFQKQPDWNIYNRSSNIYYKLSK
jgi:hypothetical protein